MIYRSFLNPSQELGLTPATKRLLESMDAKPDTAERFFEAVCMPASNISPEDCKKRLARFRNKR